MAGFDNEVAYGINADFSSADNQNVQESNGLYTDGNLWIGSTAANVGGTHVNVGNIVSPLGTLNVGFSDPNITLDVASPPFPWVDVSGAFNPDKYHGYFVTGTATGNLNAAPSQGDTMKFIVIHASQVLTLQASGAQVIQLGTVASSGGGTLTSTQQGDSVELVYQASSDTWWAKETIGTWVAA